MSEEKVTRSSYFPAIRNTVMYFLVTFKGPYAPLERAIKLGDIIDVLELAGIDVKDLKEEYAKLYETVVYISFSKVVGRDRWLGEITRKIWLFWSNKVKPRIPKKVLAQASEQAKIPEGEMGRILPPGEEEGFE
ncbi:MAG: hypothetical protein DRO00_01095 [Thermoproteota archaeon]|nr:MAG: hypothetical protein DRO00_01095 [Candidatus Korarchaeota archaeon]